MDDIKQMAKTVAQCIKGDTKKTKGYDTAATVKRVDGGTLYVSIPGGVPETPVKKTIDAKVGDTVQVHVGNGTAWLTGNRTAPPTDDAEALVAKAVAKVADKTATKAKTTAEQAQKTANGIKQHFWTDDDGAHITEVTQTEYEDDPDNAGGNLLAQAGGISVRDGQVELASFDANDGIIIGKIDEFHVGVNDVKGLSFYKANETTTSTYISGMSTQGGLGLLLQSNYASLSRAYNAQILVSASEYKGEVHIEASKSGGDTAAINLSHDGIILVTGNVRGSLETPTPSITATKGTLVATQARRFGQVVQLWIQYRNTSSIAGGQNVFEGTLNTTALRPTMSSSGAGYFGEHAMVGFLTTAGDITIRNASSTAITIPSTSTSSVMITYLVA